MERFNPFNLIHKGLRVALYGTAIDLQQTDFTSKEETETSLNKVKEIIMLFEGHAEKEDTYVFPAIADYEPAVATALEDEHIEDERLANIMNNCIKKVEKAETLLERLAAGRELNVAFAAFTAFNLQHMAKEEDIVNRVLWRYYTDYELVMLTKKIASTIDPWIQDFYNKWMIRGINNTEAYNWLKAVKEEALPVVYETIMQKALAEWPAERFNKVAQQVSKAAFEEVIY